MIYQNHHTYDHHMYDLKHKFLQSTILAEAQILLLTLIQRASDLVSRTLMVIVSSCH